MLWTALLFICIAFKQGIYNYITDKTTSADYRPIFCRYSVVNICDIFSVITHDKSITTTNTTTTTTTITVTATATTVHSSKNLTMKLS
jgi:hypothetical protein